MTEVDKIKRAQCLHSKSGWAWIGRRRVGFGHQYFIYATRLRAFWGIASPSLMSIYSQSELMDAFNGKVLI